VESKSTRHSRESLHDVVDDRYRLLRVIGEGGMGRVYEAEHTGIGRRVALKILHASIADITESVERFRSEARMMTRIANAHIVDVTDSGTTSDGRLYFVMEYLDGIELGALMTAGAMSLERALRISRQIAEALAAAHAQGVIHRDLKPENIVLVERNGDRDFVKVLDFGIALALDSDQPRRRLTQPGLAVGTPEYMAPEQAVEAKADERSDIYALGAMLYEMATGQQPYKGDTYTQILLNKVQFEAPPPREVRGDLPPEVEATIMRAMARKPENRHQTMLSLADDLTRCLDAVTQTAHAALVVPAAPKLPAVTRPLAAPVSAPVGPNADTMAVDLGSVSVKRHRHVGWLLVVLAIVAAVVAGYAFIWKPRATATKAEVPPATVLPAAGSAVKDNPTLEKPMGEKSASDSKQTRRRKKR
jgi:tRNA A-37 threonylcarbamoyl transferase component Bud32